MNKRFKKFVSSPGFKIIMIVIIILVGRKFYLNYKEIVQIEEKINCLHNEIKLAQQKNIDLKKQLENINDPEYIEKIARKKLGLVKPGELLLIPVKDDD